MTVFHKNSYSLYARLKSFADATMLGRLLKPLGKGLFALVSPYLPQPRDFLVRALPKHAVGCEVGVYRGDFSDRILRIARPRELYLIDTWDAAHTTGSRLDAQEGHDERYRFVCERFARETARETVKILRETSEEASRRFREGQLDFAYLDGDHSYEQVRKDLSAYYPLIKAGGILCGDDYDVHPGVKRAVDEFAQHNRLALRLRKGQFILVKLEGSSVNYERSAAR